MTKNVLVLGDVIGNAGCRAVVSGLKSLIKKFSADFVVVNGENSADGFGITPEIATNIFAAGADVITTGNHIWQKKEILEYLDRESRLLRPDNYPPGNPGHGYCVIETRGLRFGVINLQGRVRLPSIECPFRRAKELLRKAKSEADVVIIDFHAESTEEKEAFALYVDGDVALVFGTHTHVQTADERILPNGTAYITDVGATGPRDSVIGFEPRISVERSLTQMPFRNEVSDNLAFIHGVIVKVDADTGKAIRISRYSEASIV